VPSGRLINDNGIGIGVIIGRYCVTSVGIIYQWYC